MDPLLLTAPQLPFCPVRLLPTLPPRWRPPGRPSFPLLRASSTGVRVSSLTKSSSDDGFVDVIGIGSRKDAVLDFCLESPFVSSSRVRFWTIDSRDSLKVQLLQRTPGEDLVLRNVEFPFSLHPCSLAVILVGSAGYGSDDITALQLLNSVKSKGGLAVSVLLKPFSFEGQRRQQEVDNLVNKLQKCLHCYIVVETDALLKTEEETLAEAIRIVNNAVLASINMISTLTDDLYLKFLDAPHEEVKELQFAEIVKLLESSGETKIGYGAGYDIKSSLSQAVFNCPFLTSDMKSSSGIVIFNLASARTIDRSEVAPIVRTFRRISQCNKHMVFCGVHEPALEQNLVITTLLVLGCNEHKVSENKGFLSGLVHHFPAFFSLLRRNQLEPSDGPPNNSRSPSVNDFIVSAVKCNSEFDIGGDVLENLHSFQESEKQFLSEGIDVESKNDLSLSEDGDESILDGFQFDEDENGLQREQLVSWNFGPSFYSALLWAEERAAYSGATKKIDTVDIFPLPVGIKFPKQYIDYYHSSEVASSNNLDGSSMALKNLSLPSTDALASASLEAAMGMYNSALTHFKGKIVNSSKKQGLLSIRATSMLEAERELEKKWAPVMEMEYRGGLYKGRCQGGLPEGKGRLTLSDGSFYDGMWRYGKRSGLGTFHFSNGDVFQGIWRDDFMHGKGWFYFHTGDRWFVNFWKGKPNGEGRFYSKMGSVFFGDFRNGWRHGECLYIDANGTRWTEMWEDGVLVSQTKLDLVSGG